MNKSCVVLSIFLSILLLTTIGSAGERKNEKNAPFDLWGKGKETLCHITGTYDFGEGDVPIGHVIEVPEPAYLSRIKHGDIGDWDVVTLPDGKDVCYEQTEVCHITGTYDFGEGDVPIGEVTKVPASYYQNHIEHSDPQTYKIVTLSDGSEACLALGEEDTQFSKGIALFGYDVENGYHFTQRLFPGKMGWELTRHKDDVHGFGPMAVFYIDGKQYFMGISSHKGDKGVYYKIEQILPSGDIGPHEHGYFIHSYKTLIPITRYDGKVFIFMQEDGNGNRACVKQILPGGRLGPETWHNYWDKYFDTATPLPYNHTRQCFFIHHTKDDSSIYETTKPWYIKCIRSDGTEYVRDHGDWNNGYQVALSYRPNGPYLFGHRHRYDWSDAYYHGPWFIQKITEDSKMGNETDSGEWWNYYKTMTVYKHPDSHKFYLIGHNTDKNWFIQHVDTYGHMQEETDNGKWKNYYDYLFPIDYDEDTYAKVDNWMAHMFDNIEGFSDRKLSEIALPGSHDAGMNRADKHDCYAANECNTVTQTTDIEGQLNYGVRYFDIRPVIPCKDGFECKEVLPLEWCTGHRDNNAAGFTGCNGECKMSIVESLQDFFAGDKHPKELVILKVSHCLVEWAANSECRDGNVKAYAENLAWHLDPYLVKCDGCDIHDMTLNQILSKGNILLVFDDLKDSERDTANGIFKWGCSTGDDFCLYDEYSNTESFTKMTDDQIEKLLDSDNHDNKLFLLSWTLTLTASSAIECIDDPFTYSILDLADDAQPRIFEYMYELVEENKLTKKLFPNILYVDAVKRTQTNAAIYLNRIYDTLPD